MHRSLIYIAQAAGVVVEFASLVCFKSSFTLSACNERQGTSTRTEQHIQSSSRSLVYIQ